MKKYLESDEYAENVRRQREANARLLEARLADMKARYDAMKEKQPNGRT